MAETNFNAPPSGVLHVRTRHTENFTVLSNRLVQRPGRAATIGIAAYILSLPDGAPVRVSVLTKRFDEGRDRIAAALNELEAEGWLDRRVERGPSGRIITRTLVYDLPGATPDARPEPAPEPRPAPEPSLEPSPQPHPGSSPAPEQPLTATATATEPPASTAPTPESAPEQTAAAIGVLASLRAHDARLALTRRDQTRLAPLVSGWLSEGSSPQDVARTLAEDLPAGRLRSVAGLLTYRLTHLAPPTANRAAVPFQECPKCDRPFRAKHPGECRECREAPTPAPGGWWAQRLGERRSAKTVGSFADQVGIRPGQVTSRS
ncbi:hypothetical protein [Streptomyces sp. NPDC051569]|uniref:hypothetical protein n=1 Tax=Streptomyces sp. NPDC051569 TaxID=3365661 RepID=UPI00379FDC95